MDMAMKHCEICGAPFTPDPRTRRFQKVCDQVSCRRARKRRADQAWRVKNPGYSVGRAGKTRAWAKAYPDYWRQYRAAHPDYVQKNRERSRDRMRRSRLLFAKQDAIRRDPVGYLEGLRPRPLFAKQDAMAASLDGILVYLAAREAFAKPNDMASAPSVVAS